MGDYMTYNETTFENIKHFTEEGIEFWYARELQEVLEYKQWRRFFSVIEKAMISCKSSGNTVVEHFANVGKTIRMPKGASKEIDDYMLSRYACYLIVQNGDPRKEVIALGQTYFAVKTRQQELTESDAMLTEEQRRLAIRGDLTQHNKSLVDAAKDAGVETSKEYAIFQNNGYQGLYGGLGARDIHVRKGLKSSQKILDHMSSEELAANLFRATQAEAKLRREGIQGKDNANKAHFEVGKKVRQTIEELGGTMPEDLPTPDKSIKQIEREKNKKKQLNTK